MYHLMRHDKIAANEDIGRTWEKAVLAYFKRCLERQRKTT